MFLVFFSAESFFALLFSHKSWIFYLLSLLVWLALWLLSFLAFKLLSLVIGIASKWISSHRAKEALLRSDNLAVTYFTVIPLFLYNMILVIKIVPGKISSPLNLGVILFFVLLFAIFFLALLWTWRNPRLAIRNRPPYIVLAVLLPAINVSNAYWILPDLPVDRWGRQILFLALINILLPLIAVLVPRAFFRRPAAIKIRALSLMAAVILAAVSLAPAPDLHNPEDPRPSPAQGKAGPNVILIVMDAARTKDVSLDRSGLSITPRLSDLAREAVVFENAYANSNWTIPSHACLFTGFLSSITRTNFQNTEIEEIAPLGAQFRSLATILSEHGYRTGSYPANSYNLCRRYGFHQGFLDIWNGAPRASNFMAPMLIHKLITSPTITDWMARNLPIDEFIAAPDLNEKIFRWLNRSRERPFFLFVNYTETHGVNFLPETHKREFGVDRPPKTPVRDPRTGIPILDEAAKAYIESWYNAELHAMDYEIGRLVDFLKKKRIYEDSLIIITSDHGQLLGEHDDFDHSNWLYQEIMHIPLIVKYPQAEAGGTRNALPVQQVDIFAEILSRLGIPLPPNIQGEPFGQVSRPIIGESRPMPALVKAWPQRYNLVQTAIISRRVPGFKLIEYSNGRAELFDLLNDPGEENNLADPEKRRIILQELEQYRQELKKIARLYDKGFSKTRFDSLGYIR